MIHKNWIIDAHEIYNDDMLLELDKVNIANILFEFWSFARGRSIWMIFTRGWTIRMIIWKRPVHPIDLYKRLDHLGDHFKEACPLECVTCNFFLISLLFQAGIYPRHTKEQEKYRSYMVYVYIFQRFLTFVLYKHCLMVEKGEIISNCPKQSKTKLRSSHRRSKVRVFWEYIC